MEKVMAKQCLLTMHVIEERIHLEAFALPRLQIIPDLVLYSLEFGVAV